MDDDSPFTEQSLSDLYTKVSTPKGVTVAELRALVGEFTSRPIGKDHLQAYREGRKPWKKMRDEVVSVEHFLSALYPTSSHVRFPLNDQPPDAWLTASGGEEIGIEVTGALARAGIELAKGLVGGEIAPGFIGLQDDARQCEFDSAKAKGRITHSRKGVEETIDRAISARLISKDKSKFTGQILLIVAPVGSSPYRDVDDLKAAHAEKAQSLPFAKIYVMDVARGSIAIQLK